VKELESAAFAQPYVGPLAGALLTGLAKGYTGDYSLDGIDPSSQLCACIGMGIGTILNINPKGALKASATVATAATKTLTHMVQKEAVDIAATVARKNVSKATPWFKSFNPYSQVTQKTSQLAEKCLEKGANKLDLDALSKAGQMIDRGGLTKAGRALQKHGGRPGSLFPKPNGNLTKINQNGQDILDNILTHPKGFSKPNKLNGIDFFGPDGQGVRFFEDGKFRGFLEPNL
jgi:hypothetical protein